MSKGRDVDPVKAYLDKSTVEREAALNKMAPYFRDEFVRVLEERLAILETIQASGSWKSDITDATEKQQFAEGLPLAIKAMQEAVKDIHDNASKIAAEKAKENKTENVNAGNAQQPRRKSSLLETLSSFNIFNRHERKPSKPENESKRKRSVGRKSSVERGPKKPHGPK